MTVQSEIGARPLEPGAELRAAPRQMTRQRMRWYADVQPTVAADDGRVHRCEPTIHDDDDFAHAQGLPGIIADGMVSTNWILCLLLDTFGRDFARVGKLRTKYVQPIYEDQVVVPCARVKSVEAGPDGATVYRLDVWCEDDARIELTVGEAVVHATGR